MLADLRWPPFGVVVNQAVGLTAEEFGCAVVEAFDVMVAHAAARDLTVEQIAAEVVDHQNRCSALSLGRPRR